MYHVSPFSDKQSQCKYIENLLNRTETLEVKSNLVYLLLLTFSVKEHMESDADFYISLAVHHRAAYISDTTLPTRVKHF